MGTVHSPVAAHRTWRVAEQRPLGVCRTPRGEEGGGGGREGKREEREKGGIRER